MASMRIIKGKSDTYFDPEATITRAEFTALIVRLLRLTEASKTIPYKDVQKSDWYYQEISLAYKAGLIPKTYDSFLPLLPITREDMAIIMANAITYKKGMSELEPSAIQDVLEPFTDITGLSSYAKSALAVSVQSGIINGRTPESIVPEGNLTRAEAAAVIKRLLTVMRL